MNKKIGFYVFLGICFILNIVLDTYIKKYFEILNICFGKSIVLTNKLYAIICLVNALISILFMIDVILVVFKKESQNEGINLKEKDGTYGTANWMNETEMNEALGLNDTPGIILGKHNKNIVKLPFESYFNKNICVFGSSGSMKTTAFVQPNLLELSKYKKSIIVTDPKRRDLSNNVKLF